MDQNRLPQMCGLAVCAIVVLGADLPPAASTFVGILMGAVAHFGMALAVSKRR